MGLWWRVWGLVRFLIWLVDFRFCFCCSFVFSVSWLFWCLVCSLCLCIWVGGRGIVVCWCRFWWLGLLLGLYWRGVGLFCWGRVCWCLGCVIGLFWSSCGSFCGLRCCLVLLLFFVWCGFVWVVVFYVKYCCCIRCFGMELVLGNWLGLLLLGWLWCCGGLWWFWCIFWYCGCVLWFWFLVVLLCYWCIGFSCVICV